jgi:Uma2 family endonuclease
MATAHLINVEEYLHSTFEPDAEYVNGRIVRRSLPQKQHSKMQTFLARTLYEAGHPLGYEVWVEQRIQTKTNPAHFRIPDVCITLGEPAEDVFIEAPFLCIEILSADDSAIELRTKIDEYLAMGVQYIWIVDPISLRGDVHTTDQVERIQDGVFRAGAIELDLRVIR